MSNSNINFTAKFFRPPQRTVSCNNGLLDTRTKRIIAQDRFIVAEQRILDVERRKSSNNLQSITFEQKQLGKKLLSLHNIDHSLQQIHHHSISEANLHRLISSNDILEVNISKFHSNQNLLSLPNTNNLQQNISTYSNEDISEDPNLNSDNTESDEENFREIQPPMVSIIPPEEEEDDNV